MLIRRMLLLDGGTWKVEWYQLKLLVAVDESRIVGWHCYCDY